MQYTLVVDTAIFTLCFLITVEALHLANLMAAHGYFFPIDDHILTVKNDNTYYRFQVSNGENILLHNSMSRMDSEMFIPYLLLLAAIYRVFNT